MEITRIEEMIGVIFDNVVVTDDVLRFETGNGDFYEFYHAQDCCESVMIEEMIGDVNDLVGVPIVIAEEISNHPYETQWENQFIPNKYGDMVHPEHGDLESYTWTFYKFATIKGYVDVRWLGTSNGYYSEGVDTKTNIQIIENPEGQCL